MKFFRITLVLSLIALVAPAALAASRMEQAPPGTVNYVEGSVAIDGQQVTSHAVGYKTLKAGQVLSTTNGRAEILLTPGVFLRIGHNSAVQMVTPDLTKTQLRLTRGEALVEVDNIFKQNDIEIAEDGVMTRLVKRGLYQFNAENGRIRTFDGRALVYANPHNPNRPVKVRTSHELLIPPASAAGGDTQVALHRVKAHHFNRKRAEKTDALFQWSKLRSHYLSQANERLSYEYAGYPGFVPGWYWNPWGLGYTWLPGDGMFWNPFGWGFYSPVWMYYGYGGYPYNGYYGYTSGPARGTRVEPGRNFNGDEHFHSGPARGSFHGQPARGFGGGHAGGQGSFHGGSVNLSAGGFGGGGAHVSTQHSSGGGGHPH